MSQSESRRVAHCMYVEIELKKKKKRKKFLILKVWFYENSVKLRQSPTHASMIYSRDTPFWLENFDFSHPLLMIAHLPRVTRKSRGPARAIITQFNICRNEKRDFLL